MTSHDPLRGALYCLAGFSLYALNDITIKFLGSSYHPMQIVFFSSLAGLPLVGIYILADPRGGSLRPVLPFWTAMRMLLVVINGPLVAYTFSNLPLQQSYAIFFLMPLFICLLAALLLRERVGLASGLAILTGFVGVLIVLRPGQMPLNIAHLTALLGASFGAAYFLILRKTGAQERMAVVILYPLIAQTVSAGLVLPFFYQPMPMAHLGLTALMALEAFVGSLLVVAAYRYAPASVAAPMQYVQMIWATLFGVLYFNEPMDAATAIGIAVIVASGLLIMQRSNKNQAQQALE